MKYYLVGIKGSGMSALACYLYDLGHEVLGSDISTSFDFESGLKKRNIKVLEFSKNNIDSNYIYIIGNAYRLENEEVQAIITNGYKYFYYHEYISTLPGIKIAVSGTHGKTTTAFFLKQLLKDENIACIIGDGTGYASNNYKYLIYEACEYQDHFLSCKPDVLVITNIDYDHPDYYKNINQTINSFYKASKNAKKVITMSNIDYNIIKLTKDYSLVKVDDIVYKLNIIGQHNINNFLLCYQCLKILGFNKEYLNQRIDNLSLPKRRCEEINYLDNIVIEDDAHHPKEIEALYKMLNIKYPEYKKIVLFQPHTYSRTISLKEEFKKSLKLFDDIYVDKVFTSKREPYDVRLEVEVEEFFKCFKKYDEFDYSLLKENKQLIILLGAGDINRRFKEIIKMKIFSFSLDL